MPNVIIGETTHDSTRIWIRGDQRYGSARITVKSCDDGDHDEKPKQKDLSSDNDFIAVIPFNGLRAGTLYTVSARFASTQKKLNNNRAACHVQGKFRTFPSPGSDQPFSFLHGSCNLSVVSLTNLGGLVVGALGMLAARESLKRPTHGIVKWLLRWLLKIGNIVVTLVYFWYFVYTLVSFPFRWAYSFVRGAPKPEKPKWYKEVSLIYAVFYLVYKLTEFKQPKPLLPSPFERLCPLVATWSISFNSGEYEPSVGDKIIGNHSDATGILAYSPTLTSGSWAKNDAAGVLTLTQVSGTFEPGEVLKVGSKTVGTSASLAVRILATYTIAFNSGENEPSVGDKIIGNHSDATGILAYSPTLTSGSWAKNDAAGELVLTQVSGTFESGEVLKVGSKTVGTSASSAVRILATYTIAFNSGKNEPSVGATITGEASRATGILAYSPTLTSGSWAEHDAAGELVLTQVTGTFESGEILKVESKTVGTSTSSPVFDDQPAFMIHAGDQIYFDFPFPRRRPERAAYRLAYKEAWSEDASIRHFLAQCPHYMILDDHEIVDGFANDLVPHWCTFDSGQNEPSVGDIITGDVSHATGRLAATPTLTSGSWAEHDAVGELVLTEVSGTVKSGEILKVGSKTVGISTSENYKPEDYLGPAKKAYQEYVHVRQPKENADGTLYYRFQYGTTYFFVLDTRTERHRGNKEMINEEKQMVVFKKWLADHKDDLKFVVSSIPFVAEVRSTLTKNRDQPAADSGASSKNKSNNNSSSNRKTDEKVDKWSGRPFKAQREEIIEFVYCKEIQRLVFLVGDMHCSYHATMHVGEPDKRVTIHELAGSPINQLQFAERRMDFHDQYRGITGGSAPVRFTTWLQQFHGASSGVMHVTVSPAASPEVRWKIVRTSAKFASTGEKDGMAKPRTLSGRVSFYRHQDARVRP